MQAKNLIAAFAITLAAGAASAQDSTGTFFDFGNATANSGVTRADVQAEALRYAKTTPPLRDKYSYPNIGSQFTPVLTRAEVKSAARAAEGFSSVANNEVFDSTAYAKATTTTQPAVVKTAAK